MAHLIVSTQCLFSDHTLGQDDQCCYNAGGDVPSQEVPQGGHQGTPDSEGRAVTIFHVYKFDLLHSLCSLVEGRHRALIQIAAYSRNDAYLRAFLYQVLVLTFV